MNDTSGPDFCVFASKLGTVMSFEAGQHLFKEGDAPRYVYFILKGSVDVSINGRIIETIAERRAVGLLSLVDDAPRSVTATAHDDCELALLDKKQFRYMVEEVPNFVWFVFNELGTRLRAANTAL